MTKVSSRAVPELISEIAACNMGETVDIDVAKELIGLCRAGRLYEIDRWIAGGKSLDISGAKKRGRQKGLLELAVETGFHSLVELIARNERAQSARNTALSSAVSSRRLDFVELLVAHGADVRAVPLVDVLVAWDPKLMRFFLDNGADPIDGRPFGDPWGSPKSGHRGSPQNRP